jgi:hypothetical protein
MNKAFALRIRWAFAIFALLDLVCAGVGMGVPIFCILFGLPVGWYIARRVTTRPLQVGQMLRKILRGAAFTSAFTLVVMSIVWGPSAVMLFDSQADLANFGMPLILYDPKASFIGWLILMIMVSPFLQLLMTLFGSHITLLWMLGRGAGIGEDRISPV